MILAYGRLCFLRSLYIKPRINPGRKFICMRACARACVCVSVCVGVCGYRPLHMCVREFVLALVGVRVCQFMRMRVYEFMYVYACMCAFIWKYEIVPILIFNKFHFSKCCICFNYHIIIVSMYKHYSLSIYNILPPGESLSKSYFLMTLSEGVEGFEITSQGVICTPFPIMIRPLVFYDKIIYICSDKLFYIVCDRYNKLQLQELLNLIINGECQSPKLLFWGVNFFG